MWQESLNFKIKQDENKTMCPTKNDGMMETSGILIMTERFFSLQKNHTLILTYMDIQKDNWDNSERYLKLNMQKSSF